MLPEIAALRGVHGLAFSFEAGNVSLAAGIEAARSPPPFIFELDMLNGNGVRICIEIGQRLISETQQRKPCRPFASFPASL